MKIVIPICAAMLLAGNTVIAEDYIVDFTRVNDFETMRPLIAGCKDYSAMELYRDRLESSTNLENMRDVFVRTGLGMFNDCTAGIEGPGIAVVK